MNKLDKNLKNFHPLYVMDHGSSISFEYHKLLAAGLIGTKPPQKMPSGACIFINPANNSVRITKTLNGCKGKRSKIWLDAMLEAADMGILQHKGKTDTEAARRECMRHYFRDLAHVGTYEIDVYLPEKLGNLLRKELTGAINSGQAIGHIEGAGAAQTIYLTAWLGPGTVDWGECVKVMVYPAQSHDRHPGKTKGEICLRKNHFSGIRPHQISTFPIMWPSFLPAVEKAIRTKIFARAPKTGKKILEEAGARTVREMLEKASI